MNIPRKQWFTLQSDSVFYLPRQMTLFVLGMVCQTGNSFHKESIFYPRTKVSSILSTQNRSLMGPCLHGQPSDQCLGEMLKTAGEDIKASPSKSYSKNPNSDAVSPESRKGPIQGQSRHKRGQGPNSIVCQLFLKAHVYKILFMFSILF